MELKDRIVVDPKILVGKPLIAGTRISVEFIVDLLASGWTHDQILTNYPHLSEPDILACLQYAGELLHSERVYPIPTAGSFSPTRTSRLHATSMGPVLS